jgi:hypothetical protein
MVFTLKMLVACVLSVGEPVVVGRVVAQTQEYLYVRSDKYVYVFPKSNCAEVKGYVNEL